MKFNTNIIGGIILCLLFSLQACKEKPTNVKPQLSEEDLEAREDSLELVRAYEDQKKITHSVTAVLETDVIAAAEMDDAADDAAIWVNTEDVMGTLIFGSNKKGGIATYDLDGKEVAYHPVGKINNISVLDDVMMGKKKVSLLGGTNRSSQSLDIYLIDGLKLKLVGKVDMDTTKVDDIYGFAFAEAKDKYAIINGKNGLMQQYRLTANIDSVDLELVREIKFDDQVEGMIADNRYGFLYVGEEDRGVWQLDIDPASRKKTLLPRSTEDANPMISYDIEGLALMELGEEGYIVASSQGNFSYALFNRTGDHEYVTSFKVVDGDVDGTQETDGLYISTVPIGDQYPSGIIVIQDGFNYDGEDIHPQNFKYVSVKDVLAAVGK